MIKQPEILYIVLFIIISVIHLQYQISNNIHDIISSFEFIRILFLLLCCVIIPYYSFVNLKEYNFKVNENIKIIGYLLCIISFLVLVDLYKKINIKNKILWKMDGIYKYIRHPTYLVILLLSYVQTLFLPNKIGTAIAFVSTSAFIAQGIKKEEYMLKLKYENNDFLKEYMEHTKKIIPFIY
jgi:protein-S-isoprenylcysteine O-methyltransferase Ste14